MFLLIMYIVISMVELISKIIAIVFSKYDFL